jgi:hypothetical protein
MAFYLLDSKVPFTKNTKMPLRKNNKPVWTAHFNAIEHFFAVCYTQTQRLQQQLKQSSLWQKKTKRDQRVVSGPRKKGFLGFLVNIGSFQAIFKIYVEEKELLSYLLGHKFSQDHLEMIFGTIHISLGLNTTQQPFRKVLCQKLH